LKKTLYLIVNPIKGLNKTYPNNILKYFLNDSKAKLAINAIHKENEKVISLADQNIVDLLKDEKIDHFDVIENEFFKSVQKSEKEDDDNFFKKFDLDSDALILYTSGKILSK
jgi:acyl-CoA synthetase (AMP-forming)/AMP-acid ligase II